MTFFEKSDVPGQQKENYIVVVTCSNQGVSGANEYPFEGSFAQIVILFSWDIISHDEVALQHVI